MGSLSTIAHYRRCSRGATVIEYALIAGLVAVVLVPGLLWLRDWEERISDKLNAATGQVQIRDDNRAPVHKAEIRDGNRAPARVD
jgi:Flp pilus assembly pilin Flp